MRVFAVQQAGHNLDGKKSDVGSLAGRNLNWVSWCLSLYREDVKGVK